MLHGCWMWCSCLCGCANTFDFARTLIIMGFRLDGILFKRTRFSSTVPYFHYLQWTLVCVSHGVFFILSLGLFWGVFFSIDFRRTIAILHHSPMIVSMRVLVHSMCNLKMDSKSSINIINIQQIYTIKLVELNNSFVVVAAVRANLFNSTGLTTASTCTRSPNPFPSIVVLAW